MELSKALVFAFVAICIVLVVNVTIARPEEVYQRAEEAQCIATEIGTNTISIVIEDVTNPWDILGDKVIDKLVR